MNDFTASNGIIIGELADPLRWAVNPLNRSGLHLSPYELDALTEFVRLREDESLGRWRWPENPDYVVYPEGDLICITDERTGHGNVFGRKWYEEHRDGLLAKEAAGVYRAAGAYFDAHPEPKPWHNAQYGEVWELDFIGNTKWVVMEAGDSDEPRPVFRGFYTMAQLPLTDAAIQGGRRLWPEVTP